MAYKEMYFVADSYGSLTVHPEVLSITQNSNNTRIKLCGNFTDEALVWATIIQADGKTLPRRAVMLTTETIEIGGVEYRVYSYRLVQDDTKICPSATGIWKISFSIEGNGEEILTTNEYSLTIRRSTISAVTNTPADTIDAVATKVNQNTADIAELESGMASIDLEFNKKVDKTTAENVVYATDNNGNPVVIGYDNAFDAGYTSPTIVKRTNIGGIWIPPRTQYVLDYAASIRTVDTKIEESVTDKLGEPNGIATLDGGGKIPSGQLPSYVDDVIKVGSYADLPETGEDGKIYVTKDTNLTYRWDGSGYVEISKSLAIGETAETAYRGDRGKELYDFTSPAFESGKNLQDKLNLKADKATTYTKTEVDNIANTKVDKVTGKGLSTNDYTTAEKTKLSGIATGANNYTHPDSGVAASTYKSVTVNAQGHVTAGSNPTTLSGFGISDAYTKTEVDTAIQAAIQNTWNGEY